MGDLIKYIFFSGILHIFKNPIFFDFFRNVNLSYGISFFKDTPARNLPNTETHLAVYVNIEETNKQTNKKQTNKTQTNKTQINKQTNQETSN